MLKVPLIGKAVAEEVQAKVIEQYWRAVERAWKERLTPAILSAVDDNGKMIDVARAVYSVLPVAARLVISEKNFVAFCLKHRERLIARAAE
jgi:hypothetical protein